MISNEKGRAARRMAQGALAVACIAIVPWSALVARGAWMRSHATPENIEAAIALDPLHPYGYTLRAEHLEHLARFAEAEEAWRLALARDPRLAEAWIRLGLLQEARGAFENAEASLLKAAGTSATTRAGAASASARAAS